jgi:hypothetical protein
MFPAWATYFSGPSLLGPEGLRRARLSAEETAEWDLALREAKANGTYFIAEPMYCAVGVKPRQ